MVLSYSNNRFQLKTTYQEFQEHGDKVKSARFRWDPVARVWWTESVEKASLLISCADASARAMLGDRATEREIAITASRAQDADLGDKIADLGKTPYPFQRAGIAYALARTSVLVGDEPGLGKTLQALATVHIKQSYPCLAIVPASLKINWRKEAIACVPELREEGAIRILSGRANGTTLEPANTKLWIINYDILESWCPQLETLGLRSVIVDESHFLKNEKAKRTVAAMQLITGYNPSGQQLHGGIPERYLLSGTALINRPVELCTQLQILGVIGKFGGPWGYKQRYCGASQKLVWTRNRFGRAEQKRVWEFKGATNTDELQRLLRENCMVRRLKDDVLTDLPPKRHQAIEIGNGMGKYVEREDRLCAEYARAKVELEAERDEAAKRGDDATFEEATRKLGKAYEAYFTEMARLAHEVAVAKIPKVLEYAMELLEGQDKIVVFAHHHDVVFALEEAFKKAGIETVRLTGMDSAKEKDAAVEAFQNGTARVFIGSLHAAGVGLTLTRASQAIMAELDWTPGVMDQASDRLHRIGQTDSVLITYIVLEDSLDSKKVGMLLEKRRVIRAVLDDTLAEFDLPPEDVQERAKAKQHEYSDAERADVLACLRFLAARCDGARVEDAMGFNKIDSYFGKIMAKRADLTDRQTQVSKMFLQKYHRQLPRDLFERVYPGLLAKWAEEQEHKLSRGRATRA